MLDNKAEIAKKILEQREVSGPEGFLSETYALTNDPRVISQTIPIRERQTIAFGLLIQIIRDRAAIFSQLRSQPQKEKAELEAQEIKTETEPLPQEAPPLPEAKVPTLVPNYYQTLGVNQESTKEEIRNSYHSLMKKYHPDLFKSTPLSQEQRGDLNRWAQDINEGYLILKSDQNRQDYDVLIKSPGIETYTPLVPDFLSGVARTAAEKAAAPIKKKAAEAVAKSAVGKGVKAGVTKIAAKAGFSQVFSTFTAALGSVFGPIGTFVGKVLGWIAVSIVGKTVNFFKKHYKEIVGLALVGTGLVVGGLPGLTIMIFGGGVALGALAGAGGAGIGGLFSSFLAGITEVVLPTIGMPILISLISIPILIAIILFIINSGAYLVPPATFSLVGENPYIGVVKEAAPSGPFENSDLPISVTYTITVTAKRGTLTNITFSHECEVIRKGSSEPCPAPLPNPTPTIISPVEPYVYNYTQSYGGSTYIDSLVINTFTVTADTPEAQDTTATGATSIIIGNPPTACYNVAGNWPDKDRAMILSAISNLVGNSTRFVQRLCAAYSQVNLYYEPSKVCGLWGCAPGGNIIYFNSGGLGNLRSATYILAHESGHVLAYGTPQLYAAYRAFPGTLGELPVCTYGGLSPDEGFAEAIAKYAISDSCMANEPNNYQFVDTQIFK